MGLIDKFVDKQKVRLIRNTLTTTNAALAIETALDKCDDLGNPLVGMITPWLRENEQWAAELMNQFLLAYALGEEGLQGSGEPEVRTLVRMRIHRHMIAETISKYPGMRRQAAKEKVREEITDERIIESARTASVRLGMSVNVMAIENNGGWWQWILANWLTIAKVFLSILMLFLI